MSLSMKNAKALGASFCRIKPRDNKNPETLILWKKMVQATASGAIAQKDEKVFLEASGYTIAV